MRKKTQDVYTGSICRLYGPDEATAKQLYQTILPLKFVGNSANRWKGNRSRLADLITIQNSICDYDSISYHTIPGSEG